MARRERTLSDLGESALIERIARRAGPAAERRWRLGIGDDAALLRPRAGEEIVLTTDAQVEGVHFRLDRETPRTVGRRALAVNLSDLAAMGAAPVGCLLSLAAPRRLPVSIFDGLVAGLVSESDRYGCPLVGGNLSAARECSLHVTVLGRVAAGRALRRRGLRAGDRLYVTGVLGAAALARLRADRTGRPLRRVPVPRLAVGRWLAAQPATVACIDLSDGLATDLGHLLEGTGLGARVAAGSLPRPGGFEAACRRLGADPGQLLSSGGEDYELLFALRPGRRQPDLRGAGQRLGVAMQAIGEVVPQVGIEGLPGSAVPHHF